MGLTDTFISDLVPDKKHVRALRVVLLVAASYPFYLLTCYMAAKGFYAYEVFSSIVGLVVPVLFMALVFHARAARVHVPWLERHPRAAGQAAHRCHSTRGAVPGAVRAPPNRSRDTPILVEAEA